MSKFWSKGVSMEPLDTPLKIIKDIGYELKKESEEKLEGKVREIQTSTSHLFLYKFYIYSSQLGYSYELFIFSHSIELYPVFLKFDKTIAEQASLQFDSHKINNELQYGLKCENKEELISVIEKITNTAKVSKVIQAIISQL